MQRGRQDRPSESARAAHEYEAWFESVAAAVSAAAIDGDAATQWIYAVDTPQASFDAMRERRGEASLDDKIRSAILKNTTGPAYAQHKP